MGQRLRLLLVVALCSSGCSEAAPPTAAPDDASVVLDAEPTLDAIDATADDTRVPDVEALDAAETTTVDTGAPDTSPVADTTTAETM